MNALRPYQINDINLLRKAYREGHRRIMYALPTGGGKTVVASELIRSAAGKGHKSLLIVDRIELVSQTRKHLHAMGLKTGVLQGENT